MCKITNEYYFELGIIAYNLGKKIDMIAKNSLHTNFQLEKKYYIREPTFLHARKVKKNIAVFLNLVCMKRLSASV